MTKLIPFFALIYTAIIGSVNPLSADEIDIAALEALKQGDMRKLVLHETPKPRIDATFLNNQEVEINFAQYEGKKLLVNFWATWCAPCRAEMPSLETLNRDIGGEKFEVVTIATGRNPLPAIDIFFDEIGVETLPKHRDPLMELSRSSGVFGLPVTLILDEYGREIGRVQGEADWSAPEATALLKTFIDG